MAKSERASKKGSRKGLRGVGRAVCGTAIPCGARALLCCARYRDSERQRAAVSVRYVCIPCLSQITPHEADASTLREY
eukprot:684213-Rhodomonas_salina.1